MTRNTDWFAKCGWGVFCHYLGSPKTTSEEWNAEVDAFDVEGLARQLRSTGASYFLITSGQGSGHYCAPNDSYDRLTGIRPSKCSRRDLISDLYDVLHPMGIELLVYATADGPFADHEARRALKQPIHWNDGMAIDWTPGPHWAKFRWVEFMRNWEEVLRDWSLRWGTKVRGWWIDGSYSGDVRYPEAEEPNFRTLTDALRAGNPDAIVALNPGVMTPVISHSIREDFTTGEIAGALPECPGPWVERDGHKARYHILSYLGRDWCAGHEPRFPDDLVAAYTSYITGKGGVITWDVPITRAGLIPEAFVDQLSHIGKTVKKG